MLFEVDDLFKHIYLLVALIWMGSLAYEVDTSMLTGGSGKWSLVMSGSFTPALISVVLLIGLCYVTLKVFVTTLMRIFCASYDQETRDQKKITEKLASSRDEWIEESRSDSREFKLRRKKTLPTDRARESLRDLSLDKGNRRMSILHQVEVRNTATFRNIGMSQKAGGPLDSDVPEGRVRSPFVLIEYEQYSSPMSDVRAGVYHHKCV